MRTSKEEIEFINNIIINIKSNNIIPEAVLIKWIHNNNPFVQYYIGYYYNTQGNINKAFDIFKNCSIKYPLFSPAKFELANYYIKKSDQDDYLNEMPEVKKKEIISAVDILMSIYDLPTFNLQQQTKQYCINDQISAVAMSIPLLIKLKKFKQLEPIVLNMKNKLDGPYETFKYNYAKKHYKSICRALGACYIHLYGDDKKAYLAYKDGIKFIEKEYNKEDMILLENYACCMNYITHKSYYTETKELIRILDTFYPSNSLISIYEKSHPLRVGILSPDLNKNAVGLFSHALLHYSRHDLYIFYTRKNEDCFTETLKQPKQKWFNVHDMDNDDIYSLIVSLKIHVLIDLISIGADNKIELIIKKPAPIIINYIGHPSTGGKAYTHRIVDKITDPLPMHDELHAEKLIRLNRCFLCFTLFTNVQLPTLPEVDLNLKEGICVGIMNKSNKWSASSIQAWNYVFKTINARIYIKSEVQSKEIEDRIFHLLKFKYNKIPFRESLMDYMMDYTKFNICVDTYPYSGTTTTCMSLLMGIPVITIYDEKNPHISNVSASIMLHVDNELFKPFICKNFQEYIQCIQNVASGTFTIPKKHVIRNAFLKYMNEREFMEEFDNVLESL